VPLTYSKPLVVYDYQPTHFLYTRLHHLELEETGIEYPRIAS
jgi:hypothetical protein